MLDVHGWVLGYMICNFTGFKLDILFGVVLSTPNGYPIVGSTGMVLGTPVGYPFSK